MVQSLLLIVRLVSSRQRQVWDLRQPLNPCLRMSSKLRYCLDGRLWLAILQIHLHNTPLLFGSFLAFSMSLFSVSSGKETPTCMIWARKQVNKQSQFFGEMQFVSTRVFYDWKEYTPWCEFLPADFIYPFPGVLIKRIFLMLPEKYLVWKGPLVHGVECWISIPKTGGIGESSAWSFVWIFQRFTATFPRSSFATVRGWFVRDFLGKESHFEYAIWNWFEHLLNGGLSHIVLNLPFRMQPHL